jgi:hypothetical protein
MDGAAHACLSDRRLMRNLMRIERDPNDVPPDAWADVHSSQAASRGPHIHSDGCLCCSSLSTKTRWVTRTTELSLLASARPAPVRCVSCVRARVFSASRTSNSDELTEDRRVGGDTRPPKEIDDYGFGYLVHMISKGTLKFEISRAALSRRVTD